MNYDHQEHVENIDAQNKCVEWEHVCGGDQGYFGKLAENRFVTYHRP